MSPQLAISSAFSVLAMASLCLVSAGPSAPSTMTQGLVSVQADMPSVPSLVPGLLP